MAAKKRRGPRPAAKGFRPGKEPAHLKKRMAKAQLGTDASWAQKQAVEEVAGRSPEQVQGMVKRWSTVLFAAGLLLAGAGFFLYGYMVAAGVAVYVVAAVVLFGAYRVRKSGQGLVEMARSLE